MFPSNLSPPGPTTGIEEPPSLREMGRSPRRRIYGTEKWRTGTAKTDQGGVSTLDSIPRLKKGSGTRFYCPALKGVDNRTQEKVSKWIQLLHKQPAHLHALDIKDAQPQRDPGTKPLAGMTMSKLTNKYTIKRNKIRNKITLLRGQAEEGVDKVEKTINAFDNLLLTWRTHGTPLGDRKVKETMHKMVTGILEEIEQ